MTKILKKFFWFLLDRCSKCGGELDIWDEKRAWCKVGGQKDY